MKNSLTNIKILEEYLSIHKNDKVVETAISKLVEMKINQEIKELNVDLQQFEKKYNYSSSEFKKKIRRNQMTEMFYVTFDGRVLLPDSVVDLQPNQKYRIQILPEKESARKPKLKALQRIRARAKDLGVSDLAEQHDHYLYGTKKR